MGCEEGEKGSQCITFTPPATPLSPASAGDCLGRRRTPSESFLGRCIMWIFDSYYKGSVQLWGREHGLIQASAACPPLFYMHLPDPPVHRDMIEALESRFKNEECSFKTIFGTLEGHRIYAGRKVAERIEIQTRHQAQLYNVLPLKATWRCKPLLMSLASSS
ncbi:hypothetical protein [Methanothrix soehngenii]|uniref:hypothetical protein n=2 Tax=Methanothrix soehngenii TaxID=2223 RepID=UPI002B8CA621|nr:hypothetical protein [Methanothrix soehngenii]HOS23603.1 hypothetical protein [Methanothrix soehngenii]HPL21874.1 hypothetical protein [Methanothrix soehngenii]